MSRGKASLDFFGAIAASVTHELNNSFSIIDQAQGLLADLVVASGAGRPIDPARLGTVRERINRHVRKGVDIVGRFNRFTHTLDDPTGSFDLSGETGNIVALSRRFAELKYVRLEYNLPEDEVVIAGDAFLLQQAVFICIQLLLEGSEEGDRLEVAVQYRENALQISVAGTAKQKINENDARVVQLAFLMQDFGGAYSIGQGSPGGTALTLRIQTDDGGRK
jgi:hypothetical protein